MTDLIYVWADLNAFHTDERPGPLNEGRHGHTWRVFTYFRMGPFRDQDSLKASLGALLVEWEGKDLPCWSAEDLARIVFQAHGNADCCGVRIERAEGFGVKIGVCE